MSSISGAIAALLTSPVIPLPAPSFNFFVRSDLHLHEFYWCGKCVTVVAVDSYPVRCGGCSQAAERRFFIAAPTAPVFDMRVKIANEHGQLMQDVKIVRSTSADGATATVIQEIDRRDTDKTQHRYRKKVIRADGFVAKDVDGFLINQKLHGSAGIIREPPSHSVPGDPLHVKLDVKPAPISRRAFL